MRGSLTLADTPGTCLMCPVCWWEDDPVQLREPDRRGGANGPSLNEARENFRRLGASDPVLVNRVRPATEEELPPAG